MMPEGMSGREQQLIEISTRIFAEIWQNRLLSIKTDYETDQYRYDREVIGMIEKLLQRWKQLYDGQTKELQYIVISPLNSGVITRSYEFQIALFDQDLYIEENPLCAYWTPTFIYRDIEEDIMLYRQKASKEIIRLREDEIYEIRRRYTLCHAYITMFYLNKIVRKVYELPIWSEIAVQDIKVLYGAYMEQMVELGIAQKEVTI